VIVQEEVNKMAYQNLEKGKKRDLPQESEASQRTETPAEAQGFNNTPWTADEQKLLEQVRGFEGQSQQQRCSATTTRNNESSWNNRFYIQYSRTEE